MPVQRAWCWTFELPDLSGLELARELNAALPIIFITGHGDIAMGVGAMKAGATDFLPKPVCDTDLLRAIEQALERAVQTRASGWNSTRSVIASNG